MSLHFDLVLTSPSFWVSPYSDYQEFLSLTIRRFREDDMTYRQISKWFNDEGYKTPRGKRFSGNHVFSIQKKKRIRDERIFREIKPELKNLDLRFYTSKENRH